MDLAQRLLVSRSLIASCCMRKRISSDLAVRLATFAGVPVDDILRGSWPECAVCKACGQCV